MIDREVATPVPSWVYMGRALMGALAGKKGRTLPDLALTRHNITIDRAHLAAYCQVCGLRQREVLPPAYPFVLAFPMHMELITDAAFPFPVLGLVHLQNTIRQHRPIAVSETLTLQVRSAHLRPHDKGQQFDILITLSAAQEVVWESVSTILRRQGGGQGPKALPGAHKRSGAAAEQWWVPADTGRRYAAASGDRNPIHLYAITAKPFGFPRAVAHGMWTKARCLAAFDDVLPEAFSVEVHFKFPVLLPGRVDFSAERRSDGGYAFGLRDAQSGKPHLAGALVPVDVLV